MGSDQGPVLLRLGELPSRQAGSQQSHQAHQRSRQEGMIRHVRQAMESLRVINLLSFKHSFIGRGWKYSGQVTVARLVFVTTLLGLLT